LIDPEQVAVRQAWQPAGHFYYLLPGIAPGAVMYVLPLLNEMSCEKIC
jgi:hypothetical protein